MASKYCKYRVAGNGVYIKYRRRNSKSPRLRNPHDTIARTRLSNETVDNTRTHTLSSSCACKQLLARKSFYVREVRKWYRFLFLFFLSHAPDGACTHAHTHARTHAIELAPLSASGFFFFFFFTECIDVAIALPETPRLPSAPSAGVLLPLSALPEF